MERFPLGYEVPAKNRYNSIPALSIIQELQKVKNDNQDTMDYEAYAKAFDKKKESEVYFQKDFHDLYLTFSQGSVQNIKNRPQRIKSGSLLYGKPGNLLM